MADDLQPWPATLTRAYALDDIAVQAGKVTCERCGRDATGRLVDAYASVFDQPTEVQDGQGHYLEEIDRASFNRTIDHGYRYVNVFYNHGATLHGTPSELHSVPLGHPSVIRSDGRGLLTTTHYGAHDVGERILEAIRGGDVGGHSFTARIVRSDPQRVPRVRRGGELPRVRRLELALSEYGPTPMPYYTDAQVVAVRSAMTGQHSDPGPAGTAPPLRTGGLGAEDPHLLVHSGRQSDLARRIATARLSRGMTSGGNHT
jgi:HK97 family phage prohead protease